VGSPKAVVMDFTAVEKTSGVSDLPFTPLDSMEQAMDRPQLSVVGAGREDDDRR